MEEYKVRYDGWAIRVMAENKKQARHKAYLQFNDAFPVKQYGDFMRNIEGVEKINDGR